MKTLMIAAASLAALAVAAPAMAQDTTGTTVYGTVGYGHVSAEDVDVGAIQGRVGARFGQYFGVEGEAGFGVAGDDFQVGATNVEVDLNYEVGAFAVGYLPVSPNADLFARVGYAKSEFDISGAGATASGDVDGLAYGIGGQYFFTGKDGIRLDWTRHDSDDGDADVFGVSYVRKF